MVLKPPIDRGLDDPMAFDTENQVLYCSIRKGYGSEGELRVYDGSSRRALGKL